MLTLQALFVLFVVVCLADTFFRVPKFHYGVHERLGNRTGIIYFEGWGLKIPLIDTVEIISLGLSKSKVQAVFTTGKAPIDTNKPASTTRGDDDSKNDKIEVVTLGSLQYRANPFVFDEHGRNVFITMSEEMIDDGMEDALKDMFGGLGGIHQAEDFIENRQAFGDMVVQILKSEKPYHLNHETGGDENGKNKCGVKNCEFKDVKMIPRQDLIVFYNKHWEHLKEIITKKNAKRKVDMSVIGISPIPWLSYAASFKAESDADNPIDDISPIERRYGIDIETFALANIDFSPAMKAAFEKNREAKERARAYTIKLRMAKQAVDDLGVDGQVALNSADVSLNPDIARNKSVISVEGEAGVLGGALKAFVGNNRR